MIDGLRAGLRGEGVRMPQSQPGAIAETARATTCRVCVKPMVASERKWTVHYRGTQYLVCCPSCAQVFNRAPGQFVEEG